MDGVKINLALPETEHVSDQSITLEFPVFSQNGLIRIKFFEALLPPGLCPGWSSSFFVKPFPNEVVKIFCIAHLEGTSSAPSNARSNPSLNGFHEQV